MDFSSLLGKMKENFPAPNNTVDIKLKLKNIIPEHLEKALLIYFEVYYDAMSIAQKVNYGEIIDDFQDIVLFKSLVSVYNTYCAERKKIEPNGKPIPLGLYENIKEESLIKEAASLACKGDLASAEHAEWLIFCFNRKKD